MVDRRATLQAEQFTLAKLITSSTDSPPYAVVARSPGIAEQEAWRIAADTSLGSAGQVGHVIRAYGFLCTRGWAVAALYQAAPDPRGTHYLASHYVLLPEPTFRQMGSDFRHLVNLLPESIPQQSRFQYLSSVKQEVRYSITQNVRVVQRALGDYGVETLQRLLEPFFTGRPTAYIGFDPELAVRLDLLEALALLVPPPLRRAISFATEVLSPEDCYLRIKFMPRAMIGLRGHLVFLWKQSRVEMIGSRWDQDSSLRRCCTFLERFVRFNGLPDYLAAVENLEPAGQITVPATTADWADALAQTLEPLLSQK